MVLSRATKAFSSKDFSEVVEELEALRVLSLGVTHIRFTVSSGFSSIFKQYKRHAGLRVQSCRIYQCNYMWWGRPSLVGFAPV